MDAIRGNRGAVLGRALCGGAALLLLLLTRGETARVAPAAAAVVCLLSLSLFFLRRAAVLTLPFFLLCLLLIFCYDSYDVFVRYLWLLPVALAGLGAHLFRLRPRFRPGPSFLPLAGAALAAVLGGVGSIPPGDYFRPAALYYVVGLGPGLLCTYLLLKNEFAAGAGERPAAESFLFDLAAFGLTAAAAVYGFRLLHLSDWIAAGHLPEVQWGNNIATMLMLALPAVLALARRHMIFLPFGLLCWGAAMLSGSRGALLLSGPELIVCLAYLAFSERRPVRRLWFRAALLYAVCGALLAALFLHWKAADLFQANEARWALLRRSGENFLGNPLFGSGLGYLGNSDLYSGKRGTINWFHIFPAQVVGSMGLCGVLAWSVQLAARAWIALRARRDAYFPLALCYGGLLLMSMVNPGEFCPVPYAFAAVAIFALLEDRTAPAGAA